MKIVDAHTHLGYVQPEGGLTERLNRAGIHSCCVFSPPPIEEGEEIAKDFETRLAQVLDVTAEDRNRLFPVLWIHPYEENIIEKIDIAVSKGIDGFKIICSNFYVYEEKSIEVLKHIASLDKPVFFHSGILWDGAVSSKYNRPLNWEDLIRIKGLRFSMGHCSWPWIDECIALYGKFMHALHTGETAEMFLDTTPGTPDIYREELLTKIFTIGYDFGNNIMFGTDCNAEAYSADWAIKWLEADRKIMDKLGISASVREDMYYNNFMRFMGKSDKKIEHLSPSTDDSNAWCPLNPEVPEIIKKWYDELGFDRDYDKEFYEALSDIKISDAITIGNYDTTEKDGKRSLLSYLYMCEELEKKYDEMGISREILNDTLKDIVRWTDVWSEIKGELYLGETEWLSRHLKMKLFKIGRLQFYMTGARYAIASEGIAQGDNVIEIHIPSGEPLDIAECISSIETAKEFFAEYFPEYEYCHFVCKSWLLDEALDEMLGDDSNIVKFRGLFKIVDATPSDSILRHVFRWDTTRKKLNGVYCASGFAEKVKKYAQSGGNFKDAVGVIKIK